MPPWQAVESFSLWVLAVLGLIASWLGRGLEPALPGSMTGIERWIIATDSVTGGLSQLCAVVAVMIVLRMSGLLLIERRLGVAFRTFALPAATAVAALSVAAAHDGLDASMQGVLAVACIITAVLAIPFGLARRETRALGLTLAVGTLASALQFGALSLAIRAGEAASSTGYELSRAFATGAWLVQLGMLAFVLIWVGARHLPRISALFASCLLFSVAIALLARTGQEPDAGAVAVVVSRMMDALARPPAPYLPAGLQHALSAGVGLAALLCLAQRQRGGQGALFALCLTGAGAVDIPLSALLLCTGALVLPWLSLQNSESPPSGTEPVVSVS
jgi:hypothetical protein